MIILSGNPVELVLKSNEEVKNTEVGCGYWKFNTFIIAYDPFADHLQNHNVPCFLQTAEEQRYERYFGLENWS